MFWCNYAVFFTHQMGAYHTIELELNRKFTLAKKSWDSVVLARIGKRHLRVNNVENVTLAQYDPLTVAWTASQTRRATPRRRRTWPRW